MKADRSEADEFEMELAALAQSDGSGFDAAGHAQEDSLMLVYDGGADDDLAHRVWSHLERCEPCRKRMEEIREAFAAWEGPEGEQHLAAVGGRLRKAREGLVTVRETGKSGGDARSVGRPPGWNGRLVKRVPISDEPSASGLSFALLDGRPPPAPVALMGATLAVIIIAFLWHVNSSGQVIAKTPTSIVSPVIGRTTATVIARVDEPLPAPSVTLPASGRPSETRAAPESAHGGANAANRRDPSRTVNVDHFATVYTSQLFGDVPTKESVVASATGTRPATVTPGVYIGAEGGLNWLLNATANTNLAPNFGSVSVTPQTGWAVGGVIGYDFVGPRVELEGVYRQNQLNIGVPRTAINNQVGQLSIMANLLYDFMPASVITPYIGVGAGIGFVDSNASLGSTVFAYQGIIGVSWNIDQSFRVNLDGRYYGTSNPTVNGATWTNNNFSLMLGLQLKFGPAAPPPPPPPAAAVAPPSFMVFFDWDRSNLSAQALNTIKQAAGAFKSKGNARITATGHTDTSGPEAYNMALSLRRANAVKDALVREGVPATSITVIGRGEQGLLVQTGDGVREPQNRRVEIVIQ